MHAESKPSTGWLELRGLRCSGRHGASAAERESPQVFLLDVAVRLDVGPASQTDALSATVDFRALAAVAERVVAGPRRALLETLAMDVCRQVMERFLAVEEVRTRVVKSAPAGIPVAEESASVRLSRR